MSYTTNQLIADAFYTADIVSREFESVSGSQAEEGLRNLNFLLDEKTVDQGMIPYITIYDSSFIVGQENYFIADLVEAQTLTYTIDGSVRYPTRSLSSDHYYGAARANNINSLPFVWNVRRELGGANLSVYFRPGDTYPFQLKGIFRLSQVTQFQDLELTVDKFYINFLTYELAETLCDKWGYVVPPNIEKRISQMRRKIDKMSQPIDMSDTSIAFPSSTAGAVEIFSWSNLGQGFTPSSGW